MSNHKFVLIKSDIVDRVYARVGFSRREAGQAVEALFGQIKLELEAGENVRISGFASFYLKDKKARNARNPKTGEPIIIKARRVLSFKPSKQLIEATNES
jgi:integration host factor subunit alpha